jgi:hypothetical protein
MTDWLSDNITDPNLRQSVQDVIKAHPSTLGVFKRLVSYYENKQSAQEGDTKRRKVTDNAEASSNQLLKDQVLRVKDLSFQLPARKKYDIVFTTSHLLLFNNKTSQVEYSYNDLTFGCCVPSPDRPAFSFVLYSKNPQQDAIVFSVLEKGDMTTSDGTISGHSAICELLTKHLRVEITQPSKSTFTSSGVSDTTGKLANKAHVNAYLKAKDGSLYFLPKGILFGFKKPALFFPVTSLSSIVITGVTQRTFDLTLILKEGNPTVLGGGVSGFKPTREGNHDTVQFSMISQSEYTGIDSYIKQANIHDHSMAEERKAPAVNKQDAEGANSSSGNHGDDNEDSEQDDDFQPSDDDDDPLEYETDPEEEETERDLEAEHEDAEMEQEEVEEEEGDDDDEVDLLDESD